MNSTQPKPLSIDEVKTLFSVCDQSLSGRHDYTLLTLMFNCGISLRELADLRKTYVDFSRRWLWIVKGYARPRFVPLNLRSGRALKEWFEINPQKHFIFGDWGQGNSNLYRFLGPIRQQTIVQRLGFISEKSGIEVTAEIGKATLMRRLLEVSEEGQNILSLVPPDKHHMVQLPLENLPPFSVINHRSEMPLASKGMIPLPSEFGSPPAEDEVIKHGRVLLEKAGNLY